MSEVTKLVSHTRDELSALAIATFQNPAQPRVLEYVATGEINSDNVLVSQATDQMKARHSDLLDDKQVKELRYERLTEATEAVAQTGRDLSASKNQIESAQKAIARLAPQLVSQVLLASLTELPFPVVVLDAYYNA